MFSYSRLEAYVLIVSLCLFNLFSPVISPDVLTQIDPRAKAALMNTHSHTGQMIELNEQDWRFPLNQSPGRIRKNTSCLSTHSRTNICPAAEMTLIWGVFLFKNTDTYQLLSVIKPVYELKVQVIVILVTRVSKDCDVLIFFFSYLHRYKNKFSFSVNGPIYVSQ